MVNISKLGDSTIKFTFTDNDRYLYNGEITLPLNSLILEFDTSDLVIFKKIDGDVFVTFLLENSNFNSKDELMAWYKANMVSSGGGGGGVTPEEVEEMIDEAVSGKADSSDVYLKSETSGATEIATALNAKLDATAYTPTDLSNYYTKSETSGATEIANALSGKQDTLIAGRGIAITTGETADTVSFNLPISAGTGDNSIAEGYQTSATSIYSHAEGYQTLSSSWASHAEGSGSIASGDSSHAEGFLTLASGGHSHAEGDQTIASGDSSHAEGDQTIASGDYSHAEGVSTITNNQSEHASGQYNLSNKAYYAFGNSGNTLFSVGNGTSNSARHNAFEIRQNGDIYITKDGQDVKLQDQLGASIEVTTAVTSGSTDVVTSGGVYAKMGGMTIVKITESDYQSLSVKDPDTLYVVIPDPTNP